MGDTVSIFWGCSLSLHLGKIAWKNGGQSFCSQDMEKHERPMENCLPTFQGKKVSRYSTPQSYSELRLMVTLYTCVWGTVRGMGVTIPDIRKGKGVPEHKRMVFWAMVQSGTHHFLIVYPLDVDTWAPGHTTLQRKNVKCSHILCPGMGEEVWRTPRSLYHIANFDSDLATSFSVFISRKKLLNLLINALEVGLLYLQHHGILELEVSRIIFLVCLPFSLGVKKLKPEQVNGLAVWLPKSNWLVGWVDISRPLCHCCTLTCAQLVSSWDFFVY